MKILFLQIVVVILLYNTCKSNIVRDNPTAIVPPLNMTDPGYILAESDGGLGNGF